MVAIGETSVPLTTSRAGERNGEMVTPKSARIRVRDELCSHQILRTPLLGSQTSARSSLPFMVTLKFVSPLHVVASARVIRKEGIGSSKTLSSPYRCL